MKIVWDLIDQDLKRRFKARCASVGKTMVEVVITLIENFLKEGQDGGI